MCMYFASFISILINTNALIKFLLLIPIFFRKLSNKTKGKFWLTNQCVSFMKNSLSKRVDVFHYTSELFKLNRILNTTITQHHCHRDGNSGYVRVQRLPWGIHGRQGHHSITTIVNWGTSSSFCSTRR